MRAVTYTPPATAEPRPWWLTALTTVTRAVFTPVHRRVGVYLALPVLVAALAADTRPARNLGLAAAVVVLAAWPAFLYWGRGPVVAWYHRADGAWRTRRLAAAVLALLDGLGVPARQAQYQATEYGAVVDVRIPETVGRPRVEQAAPTLREALQVHAVTVDPVGQQSSGYARYRILTSDPLADVLPAPAPVTRPGWVPALTVPVARSEAGDLVHLPLHLRTAGGMRYLIAGTSGSGKNSVVTGLLVGAVRCGRSRVRLWLADPKATELAVFRPWADEYAVTTPEIVTQLEMLADTMRARQATLVATGAQTWTPDHGPIIVYVLDELSTVTSGLSDRNLRIRAEQALEDLAARSRSAGITLVFITQSPLVEVIPSSVRNNLDIRLAHRVLTPVMADVVIPGSTTDGYGSADQIPGDYTDDGAGTAGVFYLAGLSTTRLKARSWYLTRAEVSEALAGIPPAPQAAPVSASDPAPAPAPAARVAGDTGDDGMSLDDFYSLASLFDTGPASAGVSRPRRRRRRRATPPQHEGTDE